MKLDALRVDNEKKTTVQEQKTFHKFIRSYISSCFS